MESAERRRQLAQDKAAFSRGLDVTKPDGRQIAALMRVLHDLVKNSVARNSVSQLMHYVYENFAAGSKRFANIEVACGKGCSHCCNMWVDASPAEILYLAKTIPGRQRIDAVKAVSDAMVMTRAMSFEARGRLIKPCPILRDGSCSIYSARPLACRAAASVDASVCQRAYIELTDEQIPLPMPYMLIGSGYRLALAGAIKRAGLWHRAIELNSGLEVALSNDEAERTWLAGANPFSEAQMPPSQDILETPQYRMIYEAAFA
jgi:Fe-S-cluster containining protein